MVVFFFLLIALVVVVAAVTLAVVGGGEEAVLPDVEPERVADGLPEHRAVMPADVDALRLPVAPRGYRMAEVDEALARLAAEIAGRDEQIAALEAALRPQAPAAPPAGPPAAPPAAPPSEPPAQGGSPAPGAPSLLKGEE
ncbi:DivIVA domain-containing protein [Streptomyces sp. NPDC002054]|uniref:DivIVA domain-containing protein n=1 Tax=Streptomyces sp. NPDC002054 TaxID=3154663 RepID=UPI0033175958